MAPWNANESGSVERAPQHLTITPGLNDDAAVGLGLMEGAPFITLSAIRKQDSAYGKAGDSINIALSAEAWRDIVAQIARVVEEIDPNHETKGATRTMNYTHETGPRGTLGKSLEGVLTDAIMGKIREE